MENSIGSADSVNPRNRQKKLLQMIKVKTGTFFIFLKLHTPSPNIEGWISYICTEYTHIIHTYMLFQLDLTFLFFTKTFLFTNGCMQKKVLP